MGNPWGEGCQCQCQCCGVAMGVDEGRKGCDGLDANGDGLLTHLHFGCRVLSPPCLQAPPENVESARLAAWEGGSVNATRRVESTKEGDSMPITTCTALACVEAAVPVPPTPASPPCSFLCEPAHARRASVTRSAAQHPSNAQHSNKNPHAHRARSP